MQHNENRVPSFPSAGNFQPLQRSINNNNNGSARRAPDRARTGAAGDGLMQDRSFGGNSQGRLVRAPDSADASLLIISDFKTKEIKVAHKWRIEDFAGFAARCSENWGKLDESEKSYFQFGAPVEVYLNFDLHLREQKEDDKPVVFFGEQFATSLAPEIYDCTWNMAVYPICPMVKASASRGYDPFTTSEYGDNIAVYLHMKSSSQAAELKPTVLGNLDLKVHVSLLNANGDRYFTQSSELYTQNVINRRLGFDKFIKLTDVLQPDGPYMTDGSLNFLVEVDVFYRGSEVSLSLSNPPEWLPAPQLQMLRTSGLDYDVVIVGSDGLFNCHRAFLSARCGFFEEYFRSPEFMAVMGTPRSVHPQRITLAGIDKELISELVRFAYTDEITPKTHLAEKLLVIAEKYNTSGLKDLCEDILISALSYTNADKLHRLAEECTADSLKYQALQLLCCRNAEESKPGAASRLPVATIPEASVRYVAVSAPEESLI